MFRGGRQEKAELGRDGLRWVYALLTTWGKTKWGHGSQDAWE